MTISAIGESSALPTLAGVTTRFLADHERRFPAGPRQVPLVIERQQSRDIGVLKDVLARHSAEIRNAIYEHGAILLRGFAITSDHAFEDAVSSIDGLRPMHGYFMAEVGRDHVAGTRGVFYTNTNYKTGGSFFFGGFHSENYYSPDVPAFQSFWCKKEPSLGGETALVHMPAAYAELSDDLRSRLESEPLCPTRWPLADIARRYRIPEQLVEEFCRSSGMPVVADNGEKYVALYKPSVFRHPYTRRRSLQVNLSLEIRDLDPVLQRLVVPYYTGRKWLVHRFGWKHPMTWKALYCLHHVPTTARHPRALTESVVSGLQGLWSKQGRERRQHAPTHALPRIVDKITPDDVEALAGAIWKQCTVFPWQRDDVLIFDNLQMLHAGMPGFGTRELRVIMCNPIPIAYPAFSGLFEVPLDDRSYESLDVRLRRFAGSVAA